MQNGHTPGSAAIEIVHHTSCLDPACVLELGAGAGGGGGGGGGGGAGGKPKKDKPKKDKKATDDGTSVRRRLQCTLHGPHVL